MSQNVGQKVPESFGDRVRFSRARLRRPDGHRYTQNDLAVAVGVERNTVSRWENRGMLPKDPHMIATLARVLRVSVDWLVGGIESASVLRGVSDRMSEETVVKYGDRVRAEDLPSPVSELILRYMDRLALQGGDSAQIVEAERIMVLLAQHRLTGETPEKRPFEEMRSDVDLAWDFIVNVLRRSGIRA